MRNLACADAETTTCKCGKFFLQTRNKVVFMSWMDLSPE